MCGEEIKYFPYGVLRTFIPSFLSTLACVFSVGALIARTFMYIEGKNKWEGSFAIVAKNVTYEVGLIDSLSSLSPDDVFKEQDLFPDPAFIAATVFGFLSPFIGVTAIIFTWSLSCNIFPTTCLTIISITFGFCAIFNSLTLLSFATKLCSGECVRAHEYWSCTEKCTVAPGAVMAMGATILWIGSAISLVNLTPVQKDTTASTQAEKSFDPGQMNYPANPMSQKSFNTLSLDGTKSMENSIGPGKLNRPEMIQKSFRETIYTDGSKRIETMTLNPDGSTTVETAMVGSKRNLLKGDDVSV